MKKILIILFCMFSSHSVSADKDWMALLQNNQIEEATKLCKSLETSADPVDKASAYKCYANLAIMGKDVIIVEGNDVGGGMLRGGYRGKPLEQALIYLNKAIVLTPKDESIHQGRMHILLESGLYQKALEALKDSINVINSKEHLELWLNYTPYYFNAGQHKAGIEFTKVLKDKFGEDHRLHANLGAFYSMINEDRDAIDNMEKAIKINPSSPLNTWNLARLYDYTGKLDKADLMYEKALSLKAGPFDTDLEPRMNCLYSEFLFKKRNNKTKACAYHKEFCKVESLVCN
ncbi:MAG: hypothetical protein OEY52_14895 [Gammaproteobacteria bacterium]|nr:hypothetical protein [Gammaproteobacteria bacterium]